MHKCYFLPLLVKLVFDVDVVSSFRIQSTWVVRYRNKKGEAYVVYWQFSLKKPWLLPKYDPDFVEGWPLCGWLFFYFGKTKD